MGRITHVTGWLLGQSPKIVKKLKRNGEFIEVGDSEKLGLKDVKLIVPEGIAVYQVIREVRNNGEFFFTAREGSDTTHAYLSWLNQSNKPLNIKENIGELLKYPWYDNLDSSKVFERFYGSSKDTNLYLEKSVRQWGMHPLLRRMEI